MALQVLRHALAGDFKLVLCPLIIESARHRIREDFREHLSGLEEFLATCYCEEVSNPLKEQVRRNRDLVRSPADVPIALAAINARVDHLVSEDEHLAEVRISRTRHRRRRR